MSDATNLPCKNTRYSHMLGATPAVRYDGYCFACASVGVPELIKERDEHIRRWAEDSCETEASIEADAARAGIVRQGDSYGVEPIEDVASRMADKLAAARARIAALEAGLQPFAEYAAILDRISYYHKPSKLTGDCRHAAALLAPPTGG